MKYLTVFFISAAASPAFSHDGVHITPHGAEWMPVFMGATLICLAGFIALRAPAAEKSGADK